MRCRQGCGACCIEPAIVSGFSGMPQGKPAGVRCVQLDGHYRCRLFGKAERPAVCEAFQPEMDLCGLNRAEALQRLRWMEQATMPGGVAHSE